MKPIELKSNIMDVHDNGARLEIRVHSDPFALHLLMLIVVDCFISGKDEESGKNVIRSLLTMDHSERAQLLAQFYKLYLTAGSVQEIYYILHKAVN